MKLSVHLLTYNAAKYLPHLFSSLRNQSWQDFHLSILDNASTDNTVEILKRELASGSFSHTLVESVENKGFVGGHNELIVKCKMQNAKYILLLNHDLYLDPDCIEKLVSHLDSDKEIAITSPRLMKWDFQHIDKGIEQTKTNVIDSLGLHVFRNRRVVERGVGEKYDTAQKEYEKVFGVSGTMPMFRSSFVEQMIATDGELFDSSFFMYKEDVDLAYRLQSRGYSASVCHSAVAYHDRTAQQGVGLGDFSAAKNKQRQSPHVSYLSYRNHLATLFKNEYWQNSILDFPWIVWYEMKKLGWFLLFDRQVLKGWKDIWTGRTRIRSARQTLLQNRKRKWKALRVWIQT